MVLSDLSKDNERLSATSAMVELFRRSRSAGTFLSGGRPTTVETEENPMIPSKSAMCVMLLLYFFAEFVFSSSDVLKRSMTALTSAALPLQRISRREGVVADTVS